MTHGAERRRASHWAPAEVRSLAALGAKEAVFVTKPYEFIGFGAMDVTKPYEFNPINL